MERSSVAWRRACAVSIGAIAGLAVAQSSMSWDSAEALLFVGAPHLAILGVIALFRASAPLLTGVAVVLLAHHAALVSVLWSEASEGGLAAGLLTLFTLPGGALGAGAARILEWRRFAAFPATRRAMLGAVATFVGIAAQILIDQLGASRV